MKRILLRTAYNNLFTKLDIKHSYVTWLEDIIIYNKQVKFKYTFNQQEHNIKNMFDTPEEALKEFVKEHNIRYTKYTKHNDQYILHSFGGDEVDILTLKTVIQLV